MFGERNKVIHLIGIGGIGMSGIAEILHSLGFSIQGSDKKISGNTKRLEKLGIKIFIGHDETNIEGADIVVYSSAINQDNVEFRKAIVLGIPCLTRGEMLSQIVRLKKSVVVAGAHGKTTVTSLCAELLELANFQPTVVNGGVINSYGSNAKLGAGDWAVIESDESDGSFVRLLPSVAIVTNIDKEHIKNYGNFRNLQNAFVNFIENVPFYGVAIVCKDDPNTEYVLEKVKNRNVITYGLNNNVNFQGINIKQSNEGSVFDVKYGAEILRDVKIPLFGIHNVRNALSVIALAHTLDISTSITKTVLSSFTGTYRRFTTVGKIRDVLIVDDYAHHPTEIKALLDAAHQHKSGKVVIIHQPHRFTRLNCFFDDFCTCFSSADTVIILPVYKADEVTEAPLNSTHLFNALKQNMQSVYYADDKDVLSKLINNIIDEQRLGKNDIILFSGAGSISSWAYEIVSELQ